MSVSPHKLQPPLLPAPHVPRPHLTGRLAQGRIFCLTAAAGYGKTTLLAEYGCRHGGKCGWYTLDGADRDPVVLLSGLAASLGLPPVSPRSGATPAAILAEMHGGLVVRSGPAALVLDDLHVLDGAEAAWFWLGKWLVEAAPHLRILLAGRRMPLLPTLPRLRLLGQVQDLGADDLGFSPQEEQDLLIAAGRPQEPGLHRLTLGWPAAARMWAAAGIPGHFPYADLFDYLQAEVWAELPPERRSFLAEASVLATWEPAGCAGVVLCADPDGHLDWLRSTPVLTSRTPEGALQPHPLWRKFLQRQLQADPDRYRLLQRRAALRAAARGEEAAALDHALAAGDPGLVEPLLRRNTADLLRSGELGQLEEWLEAVPEPVLEVIPDLLLATGEALRRADRPRRAVRWLHGAVVGYAGQGQSGGLLRALCKLAGAHGDLGQWSEAGAALRQVEAELDDAAAELGDAAATAQAEALLALAEEQAAQGQGEAAASRFEQAAALLVCHGEPERAGAARAGLGARALVAQGQFEAALVALRESQAQLAGAAACDALLAEGQILLLLERWEAAAALLAQAMPSSPAQQAQLHWLQASLAAQAGDLSAAGQLCQRGDRCLAEIDRTPGLSCAALVGRGWLEHLSGRTDAAQATARQARQLADAAAVPLLQAAVRQLLEVGQPDLPQKSRHLLVDCLGIFRARCAGQDIAADAWGRAQVRGVFQFLLLQPGYAAGREVILEAFWPEAPPDQSRGALRVTLHRLRKTLQSVGCRLETTPDLVRLPPETVGWVDREVFRSHLEGARRTVSHDPEKCLEHCRAGRALYRGDLLSDVFWPWVDGYREQTRRELLDLLQLWREAALQLGRAEEAIGALEDLLVMDPGREEAQRQLMLLLARHGRRSEALRRYRQLDCWLRAELGISPAPETRALLEQLLH